MIGLSDHGLVQPRASWEMIFKRWKIILIHSYENVTRAQSGKKQHMIRELSARNFRIGTSIVSLICIAQWVQYTYGEGKLFVCLFVWSPSFEKVKRAQPGKKQHMIRELLWL
jgi:hypothetical protein